MAKNLFHSALAQMGQVWVTLKSDPMPSKFSGKPPFVMMVIDGADYSYSTENPTCEAALKGYNGSTVLLQAQGTREQATIDFIEVAEGAAAPQPAAPAAHPPRPAAPPQPARGGPPQRPQQPAAPVRPAPAARPAAQAAAPAARPPAPVREDATTFIAKRATLLRIALEQAGSATAWFNRRFAAEIQAGVVHSMGGDATQDLASTLFISGDKSGMGDALEPTNPQDDLEANQVPM